MATKWINSKGKECEIEVSSIIPYVNDKYKGFVIEWEGTIGFGQYTIDVTGNKIIGESECMDDNSDKGFLRILFEDILAQIDIRE